MKLKDYFKKAKKDKWAIGQFNFSTLEQLRGVCLSAEELNAPVILGTSEGECKYFGIDEAVSLIKVLKRKYGMEAFLNLDHGKDMDLLFEAADKGYSAVHFDGSGLSLEENIKRTKALVKYAHKKGVLVEGELGHISGESSLHNESAALNADDLTNPNDVEEFVKKTQVDSLAVSFGNIHGIYSAEPELDFDRLKEVASKSKVFLVMHGGSGIEEEKVRKAINEGVVKININTEIRSVWRDTILKELEKGEIKPYKVLSLAENEIKKKVEEKIKIFGSAGKI